MHFHTLALDGVVVSRPGGEVVFEPSPEVTGEQVGEVLAVVVQRVTRLLVRRGLLPEPGVDVYPDPLQLEEPALAACYAASIQGRIALGQRAGRRVERLGSLGPVPWVEHTGPRCARAQGFSLHANLYLAPHDPDQRERVCRYMLRPPFSHDRLEVQDNGQVRYQLRRPFSDGTTHLLFEPTELIEKLAALIPRPWANLVRYHGVFAPNARLRRHVVPGGRAAGAPPAKARARANPRRQLPWAELMRRVFALDVLACPRCGARTQVIATISDRAVIVPFLRCLGLPSDVPLLHPARPPPQHELDFW